MAIKKEFSASMSEEAEASMLNGNFQEIDNKFRTNVIKDKTGTPRVLIGEQKDGFGTGDDYGIKVSQAGNDVTTASDDKLVMSSAFNMFKIADSGSTNLTVPSPFVTDTAYFADSVSYDLDFIPYVIAYVDLNNNGFFNQLPYHPLSGTSPYSISNYFTFTTTSNSVIFSFKGDSTFTQYEGDHTIYYFLLVPTQ